MAVVDTLHGMGEGFVGVGQAVGNSLVVGTEGIFNGQAAAAVSNLYNAPSGSVTNAIKQNVSAAATQFAENAKTPEGQGKNYGAAVTLLLGGAKGAETPKPAETPAPGAVSAKTTCDSPTTCFTAGTLILENGGEVPIEEVQIGDRVLSQVGTNQKSTTEVDSSTWKDFKLRVENEDNVRDPLTVEALRSPTWIKATGAKLGSRIWFDAEDVGVKGWATVEEVNPCPSISTGKGRVVLTTFTHFNNDLYRLQVENLEKPIEVTGLHRIYSATRHDWVRTRNLHVGEKLQTYSGVRSVTGLVGEQGSKRVYNIEVEDDHTYFVSGVHVLVHNACGDAASTLPQMKGMGADERAQTLSDGGFTQTKVSNSAGKNETWDHADGSQVRVHPYGNEAAGPYKSGNNAHLHKQDSSGNQLNDRGAASTNKDETHIGVPNPKNFQQVRNRPSGS